MDLHTLEILEFDKIRDELAGFATSALGKERCRALAPLTDVGLVREALARTTEMVEAIDARIEPPLGGLRDVRQHLKRAVLGVLLEIDQILEFCDLFELTGRVYDYWARLGADYPKLDQLLTGTPDLRHLADTIRGAIDERGQVRDTSSPELAMTRRELAAFDEKIQIEFRRLLRDPKIREALRYPQPTVSGDHHVLAVAVNHRHKVVGVVHRASSTGETVYIEPARVAQFSVEVSVLKSAELREIRKVLRRLTSTIANSHEAIEKSLGILTELDFTYAKARYARTYDMIAPEIGVDGRIVLVEARHPLLEAVFRHDNIADVQTQHAVGRQVVPITVTLGEAFDLLVITGPNTGGKTVALKTVGLLSIMALSGLPIPAKPGSRIRMLRDVLADVGDEQSLQQSLSTFSSHMTRIAEILKRAGADVLVLLDELGSGTDPGEGAALGRAILDELVRLRCPAMVTTHLGDLKTYALSRPRVENGAVEFDVQTLRPTYRLMVGQTGKSCALAIARRLNLPADVLKRARKYFRRRRGRGAGGVAQIEQLREQAHQARQEALAAATQAQQAAEEFRKKTELIQQEAHVSSELERARRALQPGDQVRVARFGKTGSVVRVDPKKRTAAVTVGAVEWQLPLEELLPIAR